VCAFSASSFNSVFSLVLSSSSFDSASLPSSNFIDSFDSDTVSINVTFDHFLVPTLSLITSYSSFNTLYSLPFDFLLSAKLEALKSFFAISGAYTVNSGLLVNLGLDSLNLLESNLSLLGSDSGLVDLSGAIGSDYFVYFISLNSILLLPCFLGFRFLIFSFDVIHSLGFYSLGFKMDAIPGRINYSFELSTLFKGEHRGFCYELCGTSHSSMLILAISL
jgi:hypothetical protein